LPVPLSKWVIREKLGFADRRLRELTALHGGIIGAAPASERQILLQEFFFHLAGAVDLVAQLVNQAEHLGIDPDDVTVQLVTRSLPAASPLRSALDGAYANTRGRQLTVAPDSPDGYVFRVFAHRHVLTHQRPGNLFIRRGSWPESSLFIDPRDRSLGPSPRPALDELRTMYGIVSQRCERVLSLLP